MKEPGGSASETQRSRGNAWDLSGADFFLLKIPKSSWALNTIKFTKLGLRVFALFPVGPQLRQKRGLTLSTGQVSM